MKRLLLLINSLLLPVTLVHATSVVEWGYSGEIGPEHWGSLSPAYRFCAEGKNQSPINLTDFVEAELEEIDFDYAEGGFEVINNGHTIQVNFEPGSTLTFRGHRFELKQFHFHAPSENHINGKSYPLEAHLVHADSEGNLAVVAIMFKEGSANRVLREAWAHLPEQAGAEKALPAKISAQGLLPDEAEEDYYHFNGSLTTPPCTEGVWWFVMEEPESASKTQIEQFEQVMHHPNNRPVQPVNARPVLKAD